MPDIHSISPDNSMTSHAPHHTIEVSPVLQLQALEAMYSAAQIQVIIL